MLEPIRIPNQDLPAPVLEVIPAELVTRSTQLIEALALVNIQDAPSADHANDLSMRLHALSKDIAAQGERMKKPINALKSAVMVCIENAEKPVLAAKATLQGKLAYWNTQQAKIRAEAQAKHDAEVRKAAEVAEAERRRLQTIADEKHAQELAEANRQRDAVLAQAKANQEELAALLGTDVAEVVVPAVKVAPAPVVQVAAVQVAPPAVLAEAPRPSAIITRKVPTLVITDPKAVAALYQVGAEVLVEVNRAAVKRCLDAGLQVPGAHIEMVEQTAQRGVRG